MKPLSIHLAAAAEVEDAVAHYELQMEGLGHDLRAEIQYAIFFRELPDRIWIAAVSHGSRRPDYWDTRVPDDPGA